MLSVRCFPENEDDKELHVGKINRDASRSEAEFARQAISKGCAYGRFLLGTYMSSRTLKLSRDDFNV